MTPEPASIFIAAPDGLTLHLRAFGPRLSRRRPVVCLPGLTRTAEDFDALASALAGAPGEERRVVALDSRGRGRSRHDSEPANYSLQVELADLIAVLAATELQPAVFVGSSRGGLLTMLLAAQRPTALAGAVLNDIGPVIEQQGLMRIKSYVGKLPTPKNFEDGAEVLRRLFDQQFPKLGPDAWLAAAKRTWRTDNGPFELTYDARIADTLKEITPDTRLPPMWAQFDALSHVPVMVIRGANSDLLSRDTVTAMSQRRGDLAVLEVADEGHTPLLADEITIGRIAAFVRSCDGKVDAGD